GAPVEGLAVWSLLDGFDFAEGSASRRGLYSVDPVSLDRIARDSAAWLSQVANDHVVVVG
ncbi:MAG: family 1 glycosylhydrolase, partial [Acidimicrobiales bacterium]|nr:family 1 glycosylhydrolase [Acidimicrobiales bacterium]